jgi:hypothetical protein
VIRYAQEAAFAEGVPIVRSARPDGRLQEL